MLSQSTYVNEEGTSVPSYQAHPRPPKSKAKQNRDSARSQNYRQKKGAETMAKFSAELDKSLYFGFNIETIAMKEQNVGVTSQAKILPISTRSIGLSTQASFAKMNQTMNNLPDCSVHEAYRTSLAQLELKCLSAYRNQSMPVSVNYNDLQIPTLTSRQEQIIRSCNVNFNVTSNTINAVGSFEYEQKQYYARVPKESMPSATTITFSNLERVVKALSNPTTPRADRLDFYMNNPLPGSVWKGIQTKGKRLQNDELDPVLENPTDFWPEDYNDDDLQDDVYKFMGLLSWASRKNVKYIDNNSKIDYDGPGFKTSLISNYANNDLRNPPMRKDENGKLKWDEIGLPLGTLDEFWSPDTVDNTVVYVGALQLLGEVPFKNKSESIYCVRHEHNACKRMCHGWVPIYNNMMG